MHNSLKYTWDQFNEDVPILANKVLKRQMPNLIVGIARGGTILATTLSYRLDVPVIYYDPKRQKIEDLNLNPELNILIVDDINDTGITLESVNKQLITAFPSNLIPVREKDFRVDTIKFLTIFDNKPSIFKVDYSIRPIDKSKDDAWIIFSWEE